jgi:hypothetical protein
MTELTEDEATLDFATRHELSGWFTDLRDAIAEPPRYVIDKLLPTGITFMVAPPKTYKSTIEMALSLMVAGQEGQECEVLPEDLRNVPEHGPVLGFSAEASAGELRYMAEQGFRLKINTSNPFLIADDPWLFRLDDDDALKRMFSALKCGPKLVWLDPLRDYHSLDEQDSGDMQRLLRPLQRWAKENHAALLVVHHTRKLASGEVRNLEAADARGTSALFGLADGLITLTPKGDTSVHFNVVVKRGASWSRTIKLRVWGTGGELDAEGKAALALIAQGKSQAEMAEALGVSLSTVSRRVAALKESGHYTEVKR